METKIYSSSGFLHRCSTEELYVVTRHWLSDIKYFEQELAFFRSLMKRCFSGVQDQISQLDLIEINLSDLASRLELLKEGVNLHQFKLGETLDKNAKVEPFNYNAAQTELEGELFDFIKAFRVAKQQLFKFNAKCLI